MKVAIITPWFPNKRDGWPARFVADSAIALSQAGVRAHVGVIRGWLPSQLERFASPEHRGEIDLSSFPEIDQVRLRRYPALPKGLARRLTNIALDRTVQSLLDEEIVARRPDVIHVHTEQLAPAAVAFARRHRLPVVVTLHGQNTNARYLAVPAQAQRFRAALRDAGRLVVVGEPLRDFAARLAGRRDHIAVVWNGVTPPHEQRRPPAPDTDRIELITVANLQEGKGVDLLLEALGRLFAAGMRDWRLTLIGDGPLRSSLQEQAAQTGIADHAAFAGSMSNAEVFTHLARSDIFALPSYREAFGVAYLEAMSTGLLTIGVEGQGPSQFIANLKTGILVKPRDVDSLEQSLRALLTDDRRAWRAIASAGARYVRENCTWSAHARNLLTVFNEAIAANPGQ
ncbi:MAG: glycosyltransferase [Rhodomicrobium sp.]